MSASDANEAPTNLFDSIDVKQRADKDLEHYFAFFENGQLPENEKLARKLLIDIESYVISDNVLYRLSKPIGKAKDIQHTYKQIVIPSSMQTEVLRLIHDSPTTANHMGFARTYALLRERYFWQNMSRDTLKYVKSCPSCQTRKRPNNPCKATMLSQNIDRPMSRICMDILGPLPETNDGMKHVLILIDAFTRFPVAYAFQTRQHLD